MKKLFTILAAALFVVACGGNAKNEPKSIEDQILDYMAKIEKAVKAGEDLKAYKLTEAYGSWAESLRGEEEEEFEEALDKHEKYIIKVLTKFEDVWYDDEDEDEDEDEIVEPEVVMVYSNCFDGYLNVRAAASTKSQVLGILRNGEAAELLSIEGKWTKVRVNGIEGYIWSADTQSTPSDPVYISSASVIGEWEWCDEYAHFDYCTIKSNGDFRLTGYLSGDVSGKWHLSGHNLVLKFKNGSSAVCGVTGKTIVINNREYDKI